MFLTMGYIKTACNWQLVLSRALWSVSRNTLWNFLKRFDSVSEKLFQNIIHAFEFLFE